LARVFPDYYITYCLCRNSMRLHSLHMVTQAHLLFLILLLKLIVQSLLTLVLLIWFSYTYTDIFLRIQHRI
jgi:hypothetical protein